ncbi:MAG: hypothetical protein A2147_03235 [Chloroflexi bacterium RBG_16_57_8]|nr:MAG: hypothetical protein A2147_03235 [Chloroflexi bacterium RBG_16_57_8]
METGERIAQLESEIKVLKNEVQAVLLDLRDKYLEAENPFNAPHSTGISQQMIFDHQSRPNAEPTGKPATNESKDEAPESTGTPDMSTDAKPDTAHAEVTRARRADETPRHKPQRSQESGVNIGLVTIGGLASWADESVRRLGRRRTETILDISEMMGLLPPDLKPIMAKLISIEADEHSEVLSAVEYLDSLVKITTLLGKDNQTEQAMLSILSVEDGHR